MNNLLLLTHDIFARKILQIIGGEKLCSAKRKNKLQAEKKLKQERKQLNQVAVDLLKAQKTANK